VEEPDFTEADAKMLEEAEGVFRDLASQMRAFAQNEILAVWIQYDPVMASAGLIGMSNSLATYGRCGRQHRGRCCGGGVGIRENTQLLTGRARMAVQIEQTGGPPCRRLKKEIRKKRNKNQPKTHVSAYKAAQGEGKPSFNPFARKT